MSTNWWKHISGGRFTYSQRLLEYQRFPNFPFSYCGVRELIPWDSRTYTVGFESLNRGI